MSNKKYLTIKISYEVGNEADLLKLQIIKSLITQGLFATDLIYYNSLKNKALNKYLYEGEED